jgi:MtN3 and saliva related transmembrane protein
LITYTVIVGLVAGTCSTFAFVPQVVKIWRDGDTDAISLKMYILRVTGFVLWLGYGFVLGSMPLILFNLISIGLGGTILYLKVRGQHATEEGGSAAPAAGTLPLQPAPAQKAA